MDFDFGYDFRHRELFFTDKNGDEREKVLEVKIDRNIDNKGTNSVEIEFQNDTIIERGNFYDEEIGIASIISDLGIAYEKAIVVENNKGNRNFKIGEKGKKIFFIIGEFKDNEDEDKYDDEFPNYLEVNDEELEEIIEKVKQVNEKYGIYCRVPKNHHYFYVNDLGEIKETRDNRFETDDKRYKIGNYFVTKNRAIVYLKKLLIFNQGNSNLFFQKEYWENDEEDK